MKFLIAVAIAFPVFASAKPLSNEVAKINAEAASSGSKIRPLTVSDFLKWYREFSFQYQKEDRLLESYLKSGQLPGEVSFKLIREGEGGIIVDGPIVDMSSNGPGGNPPSPEIAVIRGMNLMSPYLAPFRSECHNQGESRDLCVEEYVPPAASRRAGFPNNVPVKISPYRVPGTCLVPGICEFDSLKVEFLVSSSNLGDFISYFSRGFDLRDRAALLKKMVAKKEQWIALEQIFPNWIRNKMNTFPEKGDNEVCHGPARQFYNAQLFNGAHDRSTQTTAVLLGSFYCQLGDEHEPDFGDYLYRTGFHSARFLLKDPHSGRWINFSVYSGGNVPYRVWWSDQDFSDQPFGNQPDRDFRRRVDVWSRCK